jgi:hypothetical protein
VTYLSSPGGIRTALLGVKIDRATATIPQTATSSIFTVTGGRAVITSILGEVTTAIGAVAINFNLVYTPSGGAAADLCAATACISDPVGTLYSLVSGIATDLLSIQSYTIAASVPVLASEIPTVTFAQLLREPVVVDAGAVGFKTSASTTGSVKWSLSYIPYDDGVKVVAA